MRESVLRHGRPSGAIASGKTRVLNGAVRRPPAEDPTEAYVYLRPHPPFRAKPARRPLSPKRRGADVERKKASVSIKARRHPIKLARLATVPALKVLRASAHA